MKTILFAASGYNLAETGRMLEIAKASRGKFKILFMSYGGQNTVMQACLSGTPIVGIGMHPEQQANLDACTRKGFAIRLSKKNVTAPAVLDAVHTLLHSENAKNTAAEFQRKLKEWDGPTNAARFLWDTFGD